MILAAVIILLLAVLSGGFLLARSGRYHIFYFSLCGLVQLLFVINFLLLVSVLHQTDVAISPDEPAEMRSAAPHFSADHLFQFLLLLNLALLGLLSLSSVINLFISRNKRAVKIVSGIMILLCGLTWFILYQLSHLGKIGG